MQPTIMKFGGTSVEGATAFQNVARIISARCSLRPVVVVSAMAGFTDALLQSVQGSTDQRLSNSATLLEKHFERHLRVIDALLSNEAGRMRELIDHSRIEIHRLLNSLTPENRKSTEDAVVSHGEQLSSAMLAAVLIENKINANYVDARSMHHHR